MNNKNKRSDKLDSKSNSTIWGGRFDAGPTDLMERINSSIDFDQRLYKQDIAASIAHSAMLIDQGIISQKDGMAISKGLNTILVEIEKGNFKFSNELEDIHMNVENRLSELIGDIAGRLHTARSRNDQVATDFRLWVRDALDRSDKALMEFQEILITRAEEHYNTVMPGYTHLQSAQPITLGHHLLAYVEMIGRDRGRGKDCRKRLNESPLGSGALAGTSFPIDRFKTASTLGFDGPMSNSMDGVSDRDFVLEYLSFASIVAIHLSRLSEELVIWSNPSFGFVSLSDNFSTGSSMLPQKRNPDAPELVRAKTGRIVGALYNLFIIMKGLPLTYSKDMQEDKEPVFDAADTLELCIYTLTGMMDEIIFNPEPMLKAATSGNSNAIDLADWLVKILGKPFREAHHITGALVKLAESRGCALEELSLNDLQAVDSEITNEVFGVLKLENSINSRNSFGGTAPENVKSACVTARKKYL